jgi:hypothetical protein
MIVAVKLDPGTYERIRDFVERGLFESVENFIEISILNQILLESNGLSGLKAKESKVTSDEQVRSKASQIKQQVGVQQSIKYLACPKDAQIPVLSPLPVTDETKSFPIWGQINRLAPVKIVLRILANQLLLLGNDRIDLKRFSADVAETATLARAYIEKKDKEDRIRGKELYIALAKKDPGSQQRFINFYIGKLPSGKWTDGILTGLGFARIEQTEEGAIVIGLTEAGRKFACLSSPLIDDFLLQEKQIKHPFSSAEVDFLLDHLEVNRPGEFDFLVSILRFTKDGSITPTALRQKVGKFLQEKHPAVNFTEKLVNTMQVGAIGRLVEMRLLDIEKDAQKSKYVVMENGEVLLTLGVKA